ncbi:helix-turn-helix transcriptional regulator [Candidatus Daviesbacteria bacterium]|nr:helix-turn-helix transcriptional regulator [Candidatus Daviesbacteria bacterium]
MVRREAGTEEHSATERKGLTPREVQVLTLVAMGHTRDKTAASLGTSGHTVQNQMLDILLRLGVHTTLQASLTAVEQGIINPREIVKIRGISDPAAILSRLSHRERVVLATMSLNGGRKSSYEEMADTLGVSPHTIKNHLARIYTAFGVRNGTFAVMLFVAAEASRPPTSIVK